MYLGAHPDVQLGTEKQPVLARAVADGVAGQLPLAGEQHHRFGVKPEELASLRSIQERLRYGVAACVQVSLSAAYAHYRLVLH